MARYMRAAPRAYYDEWDNDGSPPDAPTVCDHEAVDTGLVFEDGTPIMRAPNPIGFGRDEEW